MNQISSTIILLFISMCLNAQHYANIVFEGAGIRGIAYVGAIKELEQQHMLSDITRVGGTSAGAIAALTLSLGYSAKEIETIIYNLKFQKFNDGQFLFFGGLPRLNKNYGWYRGKAFEQWIEKIIANKTCNSEITFRELKALNFRDLYVTGTSLNHQKNIIFSYETYPDMKIKDAVRISMSIPLYFEAVFIDSTGHVFIGKHKSSYADFDIMVDGGFTGNFPIYIFDSLVNINGQAIRWSNKNTLGLRIDSPEQIKCDNENVGLAPIQINRFSNYILAFYVYTIESLNRSMLNEDDWNRTVSISSGSIGPKVRKLSSKEKTDLIENGATAMKVLSIN